MLNGLKTYIGIAGWAITTISGGWLPDFADVLSQVSTGCLGLAGLGAAHKVAKVSPPTAKPEAEAPSATPPAAVIGMIAACLGLAACQTVNVNSESPGSKGQDVGMPDSDVALEAVKARNADAADEDEEDPVEGE